MNGGFGDLHSSLESMSFGQLLLAFAAFIGYAVAQGRLVDGRSRVWAWCVAVCSVVGFCALGNEWMAAAMLIAFALVGLGLFSAIVWAMSALMGLRRRTGAGVDADAPDSSTASADPASGEPAVRNGAPTTPALPSL